MATNTKRFRSSNDPRLTSTQVSIRIPYMYREQLQRLAEKQGVSLPMLVVETLQRVYRPVAPPIRRVDDEAEG